MASETQMKNGIWYDNYGDVLKIAHARSERGFRRNRFHMHTAYEIHVTVSGRAILQCGSTSVELRAPYVAVHRPYVPHRITAFDDGVVYERFILNCPEDFTANLLRFVPQAQPLFSHAFFALLLTEAHAARLNPLLEHAEALFRSGRPTAFSLSLAAALEEVSAILPEAEVAAAFGGDEMNELVRYLLDNLSEKLEVADVANHFYVSESTLTKNFRSSFGISFHQYLLQLRVKRAKELLDAGVSGVETARECGFASHSHFITVFRNYLGLTPGEYVAEMGKETRTGT